MRKHCYITKGVVRFCKKRRTPVNSWRRRRVFKQGFEPQLAAFVDS